MGNNSSTPKPVEQNVKEEKVQNTIDFTRLFQPKEEKVESSPVQAVTQPKSKKGQAVRNTAVIALFGYILYRAVEPLIKKDDSKPKRTTRTTIVQTPPAPAQSTTAPAQSTTASSTAAV